MRKKHRFLTFGKAVWGVLLIATLALGSTYAMWNQGLRITHPVTSGSLEFVFDDDSSCRAYILKEGVKSPATEAEVSCRLNDDGGSAYLSIEEGLAWDMLAEEGYILAIELPLTPSEDSSVQTALSTEAALQGEPDCIIPLGGVTALLELGGEQYSLDGLAPPSTDCELYHSVGEDGVYTVFLRLCPLGEGDEGFTIDYALLPDDLALAVARESEDEGRLSGDLLVYYRIEIPLYVEQG